MTALGWRGPTFASAFLELPDVFHAQAQALADVGEALPLVEAEPSRGDLPLALAGWPRKHGLARAVSTRAE